MPFVENKDCLVDYTVCGEGKGLVLLHGTGLSAEGNWPQVAASFAPTYKVVCPNFSGSGLTRDNHPELNLQMLAKQALSAASHAGVEEFDLVGNSLGACVAIYIAAYFPRRVGKVALIGAAAKYNDPRNLLRMDIWTKLAAEDPHLMSKLSLISVFSPNFFYKLSDERVQELVEHAYTYLNWDGYLRQAAILRDLNITKEAMTMRQHTLVIGCKYDNIVPVIHAKRLSELIMHARYAELDAGHAGCIENPTQFIRLLEDFLFDPYNF